MQFRGHAISLTSVRIAFGDCACARSTTAGKPAASVQAPADTAEGRQGGFLPLHYVAARGADTGCMAALVAATSVEALGVYTDVGRIDCSTRYNDAAAACFQSGLRCLCGCVFESSCS